MKKTKAPIPTLHPDSFVIDSHCHLDMNAYHDDLSEVLRKAEAHGVRGIITIGVDTGSSRAAIELARQFPLLRASVGIHPQEVATIDDTTYSDLKDMVRDNRQYVVGYGEIGLDYAKGTTRPALQRQAFAEQLQLAKELDLPVIIHDRDAHDDTIAILRQGSPYPAGGVMHCFSGDLALAQEVCKMGLHISIPGVVTFKNGKMLQEVATEIPLESLILETDGPFLTPSPWRGTRNEPAYLLYTAQKIAQLKGISLEKVAMQTSCNVGNLFKFRPTRISL